MVIAVKYRILGKSGLRVSEMCLGTMTFGSTEAWASSAEATQKIFSAYADAGGNFLDTANMYAGGESERWIGKLVGAARSRFVIASKYTNAVPGSGDPNAGGSHRKSLVQALDASLKRLGTDYIDLYMVHFWDYTVPVEEVMRALDDAVRAGKILHAGLSDVPAWVVSRAQAFHELRGTAPVTCMQLEYSLVERSIEREHLPLAADNNIGVTAWSPLAGGILSGKYTRTQPLDAKNRMASMQLQELNARNRAIAVAVDAIADRLGIESSQLALAWMLAKGVIPIVGATRHQQIEQNLKATQVRLDADVIAELDAASQFDLGHPYKMYYWDMSMQLGYGGMFDDIELPRYPLPAIGRWSAR